ncbi:hypothetical protein Vi05172_g13688 [Venturia inaequalis]|nr:hypothetical protein Vi05172_g13688 [Venturia inaequalis]
MKAASPGLNSRVITIERLCFFSNYEANLPISPLRNRAHSFFLAL